MATGRGVDQGKTKFLESFLPGNRDAGREEVNRAWRAEGHDDDISGSLISKTRSRLNITAKPGAKGGESGGKRGPGPKGKGEPKTARVGGASKSGEARSQPDGRGDGTGPNKSAFVEEALRRDRGANVAAINRRWNEAGHEGSISNSVFYKIKREMGEAGGRTPAAEMSPEGSAGGSAAGRTDERPRTAGRESVDAGASRVETPGSGLSEEVVDEVEAGIDHLIFTLKLNGGMPEVEEALRAARRLLTRRNGG